MDWGEVFGDQVTATAILDRLLHHSTTLNIKGESYRLKDKRKAGLVPGTTAQQEDSDDPPLSAKLSSWRFSLKLTNRRRHGCIHATLFRRT